jgi:N-formylmaleamate deformylase
MITWQEHDDTVNGIKLHYHRTGGPNRPLILLHGITDSGQCWPLVGEALAPGYDVIAIDARGHGKSDKPETGYARDDHAKDVAALIDSLGLENPAVMGHSMGAGTATTLAAMFPQVPAVLILEDPPWRASDSSVPTHVRAGEWEQVIRERKKLNRDELHAQGREDNPSWPEEVFAPWIEAKYDVSPDVVKYIDGNNFSWEAAAQRIQCPTLLITGDPDLGAIVTPETAEEVRSANQWIEVAHIPGAGHNIRREQWDAYLTVVKTFLDDKYPSERAA